MIKFISLTIINWFDYFYKKKIIKFLKKNNYNQFIIFFDIGAHKGESIKLFTKHFKIEKIFSFEPSLYSYEYLKEILNSELSKNSEIKIENLALGSVKKEIDLFQSAESSSSTINAINKDSKYFLKKLKYFNGEKESFYKKIKAQMITLDDYIIENNIKQIDFLKIDTEGSEFEILKGLKKNIFKVKLILFEHHYDDMIKKNYTFSEIHDLLVESNFKRILKAKMPFRKTFEYIYTNNRKFN